MTIHPVFEYEDEHGSRLEPRDLLYYGFPLSSSIEWLKRQLKRQYLDSSWVPVSQLLILSLPLKL